MVDGTRSGRVTKGRPQAPKTGNAKGAKPQGVTKNKVRPAPKRDASTPPKPRAGRSRAKKGVTAAPDEYLEKQRDAPAPAAILEEPQAPPPPPTSKVTRIYNEIWASTLDSIAFVSEDSLSTDPDTNTITLNLIDHIIKPENWNPDLSYNVLSATCFFFASKVTGQKRNTPDRIASAMKVDLHLIEAMAGPQVHYDPVVRARLAEALRVGPDDVTKGYKILFAQKEALKEFVGAYAGNLDKLPEPSELGKMEVQNVMANVGWKEGEGLGSWKKGIASPIRAASRVFPEAGLGWRPEGSVEEEEEEQAEAKESEEVVPSVEEAAIEAEKASEVELDDSELDDFDRFVEENE
ncbi:hypothetical protein M409DRAFT_60245 [Zasmidium cellare ATCC 36951]|uniref:G-patch domain-containing protein n=1 Tax=Zasmidium cellare ATCC 36951 TaxID=1080233 RepID=A0A6A6C1I9_ZASCE|nr:uncharacterized protein M409DRAFT_60245 [Zasmidium cellare ATCC 36951]KAF2160138.1 hypothetical protein M409DRAFT_60245 [Zasmidium cellare ATCC 36951]